MPSPSLLLAAVALGLCVSACGLGGIEFHPDHPGRTYSQKVKSASRVEHADFGCETIGTLTLSRDAENEMPAVAARVAEVGGTHYLVRVKEGPAYLSTYGAASRFGNTTIVSTNTRVRHDSSSVITVLDCSAGSEDEHDAPVVRHREAEHVTVDVSPRLVAVRQNPKSPELGATRAEAKVICDSEHGQWIDQGDTVGCKVGGPVVFACVLVEQQASKCTTYYEGADLAERRQQMIDELGAPESQTVSEAGFRVYTWGGGTHVLTMDARAVRVTVSTPPGPSDAP